jgi:hypothetical protein
MLITVKKINKNANNTKFKCNIIVKIVQKQFALIVECLAQK